MSRFRHSRQVMRRGATLGTKHGAAYAAQKVGVTSATIRNWMKVIAAPNMRAARKAPLKLVKRPQQEGAPLVELTVTLDRLIRSAVRRELRNLLNLEE